MGTILIQIVFYQILFLALYEVLLKRDTHYTLQRFYLLLFPVLAIFLPYAIVPSLSDGISETYQLSLSTVLLNESITKSETVTKGSEYSILLIIWGIGAILSSIGFLWKLRNLRQLRLTAHMAYKRGYKLATLPNTDTAFSFGNTIFMGEQLEEEEREIILNHEKVHVTHKHSIDLLIYQILRIIFWWNPIVYVFQNRLEAVHEYIADAEVVQNITKKKYYESLLTQVFKTSGMSFTNTFYKESLIKKRIIMLQKIKSPRKSKFKYLLVLPLLSFMLVVASCANDETLKPDSTNATESIPTPPVPPTPPKISEEVEVESVPFSLIENAPVFPGCEGDEKELKDCMNKKITEAVISNFNMDVSKGLGLEGEQRLMVVFTIDNNGMVTDVKARGPNETLENEAQRVINLLPKFIPGKQRGSKVPVTYTLPIKFTVDSE